MKKDKLDIYTDYLICQNGHATATGLSALLDGDMSHLCPRGYDQITRFISEEDYTSKDLWRETKAVVRDIERDDGCLIFDDTVQEKAWTDENELVCWRYDHSKGRSVKGINMLNAPCHSGDVSVPVASGIAHKPHMHSDLKDRKAKRASAATKNELTPFRAQVRGDAGRRGAGSRPAAALPPSVAVVGQTGRARLAEGI